MFSESKDSRVCADIKIDLYVLLCNVVMSIADKHSCHSVLAYIGMQEKILGS